MKVPGRRAEIGVVPKQPHSDEDAQGDQLELFPFTAAEKRFWPLVKVLLNTEILKDRILFGSDFYMVRIRGKERIFSIGLRAAVGDPEFRRMAQANAQAFLGWKEP